jgi:arylsulfatase A-like enzyme
VSWRRLTLRRHQEQFCDALALAALANVLLRISALWLSQSLPATGQGPNLLDSVAGIRDELAILCSLMLIHFTIVRIVKRGKTVFASAFSLVYFSIAALQAFDVVMLIRTGTPFDISMLSYLSPANSGTVLSTVASLDSSHLLIFIFTSLFIVPILSYLLHIYSKLTIFYTSIAALVIFSIAAVASEIIPAKPSYWREEGMGASPVLLSLKLFFPSNATSTALKGEYGSGGLVISAKPPTGLTAQAGLNNCCSGMNIVLITIDSVPYKSASRDIVLSAAQSYPNLAMLYRQGIAFDNFYTVFPSSTQALGSIIGSMAPHVGALGSTLERARPQPTLSGELKAKGYRTAHFMSGELRFAGVDKFLSNKGFDVVQDSEDMRCGAREGETMSIYSHKGDMCAAKAAVSWLAANQKGSQRQPFFLWSWFTNPHSPYYTRDKAFSRGSITLERHAASLRETDAALGLIVRQLEQQGLMQSTIILLTSDHGEAFGEHGFKLHGGSLFEEQVRIPMVLVAPHRMAASRQSIIGSTLDIAPTLLSMVGGTAPNAWEGHSLFSADRPGHVYFTKTSGGIAVGTIRRNRKIIISASKDRPYYYDLTVDPDEKRALLFDRAQEQIILREVSDYVGAVNSRL